MNKYQIDPNKPIKLKDWDPDDTSAFDGNKDEGRERLLALNERLEGLQELLFAEHAHPVLVVLQGMDTSGKDGVISHVFEGVNPQGVRVASFKVPTALELSHDYLWRIHSNTPAKGEMVIFNRSHYEDVLVVRVHKLVPEQTWEKRYQQINDFERTLNEEGAVIIKFFLHISKDEQKKRLQERLDDPAKRWKFSLGDLKERELWDDYMAAYQDMLNKTSTSYAPWYLVPANKKWYRNLVIAEVLVDALKKLDMKYPEFEGDPTKIVIP